MVIKGRSNGAYFVVQIAFAVQGLDQFTIGMKFFERLAD